MRRRPPSSPNTREPAKAASTTLDSRSAVTYPTATRWNASCTMPYVRADAMPMTVNRRQFSRMLDAMTARRLVQRPKTVVDTPVPTNEARAYSGVSVERMPFASTTEYPPIVIATTSADHNAGPLARPGSRHSPAATTTIAPMPAGLM